MDNFNEIILQDLYKLGWPNIQNSEKDNLDEINISTDIPTSPFSPGYVGEYRFDANDNYMYICVSENNWIRTNMKYE
jgi:hypothetical protein